MAFVIIELAIDGEYEFSVIAVERLISGLEIDDGQSGMSHRKASFLIEVYAFSVRATMLECVEHCVDGIAHALTVFVQFPETDDSTHIYILSVLRIWNNHKRSRLCPACS